MGERNFDIRKRWRVVEVAQAQAGIESAWVCGGRCLSRLGFGRICFRVIVIVAGRLFDRRDVVDGAVEAFGVVPVHPLIGGPFNLCPGGERSHPGMVDLLACKQPDSRLHELLS